MSAIARVAFNLDAMKMVIPEHETNHIIDSYFRYVAEDRQTDYSGRANDDISVCTDDCAVLAKNALRGAGQADELLEEADEALQLRINARKKYAEMYGGNVYDAPVDGAPITEGPSILDGAPNIEGQSVVEDELTHSSIAKTVTEELIDIL